MSGLTITVVGIGAEGWVGLAGPARDVIRDADVIYGSARQLAAIPAANPEAGQERVTWPTPLAPALDALLQRHSGQVVVLASGDPMLHGIGATLARRLGPGATHDGRLRIIPHLSAFALACARLGWPQHETLLLSAVNAPVEIVARALSPGARIVLYGSGRDFAARAAGVLRARGYGASAFTTLERLGALDERILPTTAAAHDGELHDPLSTVAIHAIPDSGALLRTATPGLPDAAYSHDGAITKRHVRAVTLAALAPAPGQLLWDIGAGSGSIAIEWLRAEATTQAIAIESRADRVERITENARHLGVPDRLTLIEGAAPEALAGLKAPDAIFIGGGLTNGVIDIARAVLKPGGRLVANAVTIEGEQLLLNARSAIGGHLVKLEVSHAEPLGSYTAWRPALPIVQWEYIRP